GPSVRNRRESPSRNDTTAALARLSSVAAKSVRRQDIHRRFPQSTPPGRTARADENRCDLALMANAFGEGPGPLSRDVHKPGVPRDLIENGQDPLWFRHKAAVEVRFELQQGVIDSQAV